MYKKTKNLFMCLCLGAVVFVPLHAWGQVLTEEEVTLVMESESVEGAFQQCAASYPHPEAIDFVLLIGADGQTSLTKTDPAVDSQLFLCFQTAAKNIKMKATGMKLEIIYPMQFSPYVQPVPSPEPAPPAGAVVTVPATAVPAATAAGTPQPAPAQQPKDGWANPHWESQYRTGRGMVIAGAIMMPVGGVFILGSLFAYLAYTAPCGIVNFFGADEECSVPRAVSITFFTGVALLITGMVVLIVGVSKKNKALRMRYGYLLPQVGMLPTPEDNGGLMTLAWRF